MLSANTSELNALKGTTVDLSGKTVMGRNVETNTVLGSANTARALQTPTPTPHTQVHWVHHGPASSWVWYFPLPSISLFSVRSQRYRGQNTASMISPKTWYGHVLMKISIDEGDEEDKMVMDIEREHQLPRRDLLCVENSLTLGAGWELGKHRRSKNWKDSIHLSCLLRPSTSLPVMSLLKCFPNKFVYSQQEMFQTDLFEDAFNYCHVDNEESSHPSTYKLNCMYIHFFLTNFTAR